MQVVFDLEREAQALAIFLAQLVREGVTATVQQTLPGMVLVTLTGGF